jgi:predicted HTH transcriptional regulator
MSSDFPFADEALDRIFSFESAISDRLISRENSRLEFKESFNLGSADEYAKTAAAFANTQGGYIVFGVKDSPRQVVGLNTNNFETFDAAKLTNALNERFAPEIHWESHIRWERRSKVGQLFISEAVQKPVVCTRNGGCLQQGAIYYRYRGRSQAIRYPEIRRALTDAGAEGTPPPMPRPCVSNTFAHSNRRVAAPGTANRPIVRNCLIPQTFTHSNL